MSHCKISHRLAEQSQLLAEEKWIKTALKKIRNQRNCLQIERLHLEGLKSQLKMKLDGHQNESDGQMPVEARQFMTEHEERAINEVIDFDDALNDEGHNEELNLDVNNCPYGNIMERDPFDMEEEEEDEEEEGISPEDLVIDMNMFMNGTPAKWN